MDSSQKGFEGLALKLHYASAEQPATQSCRRYDAKGLECILAVLHNLHASPDSFSERASEALYYLHDVLYYLHVLTTNVRC